MKRILALILLICMLSACSAAGNEGESGTLPFSSQSESVSENTQNTTENILALNPEIHNAEKSEIKGLWIAIYELAPEEKGEEAYREKINNMMKNVSSFGFTDVFVQVRANCDAIYPSSFFPASENYSENGKLYFDALKIIVKSAHKNNLKVHAWVNPYRICSDCDTQPLNIPVGVSNDYVYNNGKAYYLNPSNERTNTVILCGIREIIENYDVDGVHIDDYFYPTQNTKIDEKEFDAYLRAGGTNDLDNFRRDSVSALISSIYSLVKSVDDNIVFSISPGADIAKDKNLLYADVEKWCSESGYCDMIIPQIYFGFENSSKPFDETLKKWNKLDRSEDTKLCVGLAIYKSGKEDKYAGFGKNEWIENNDIIKRQIKLLRKEGADGFCLFSYNYVFGNRNFTKEEVKNIKSVI